MIGADIFFKKSKLRFFVIKDNFLLSVIAASFSTIGRLNFLCLGRFFKIDAHFFKDQKSLSKIKSLFQRSQDTFFAQDHFSR